MALTASSPIDFVFERSGGADIQAEVQVWPRKDSFGPDDRPVARVNFFNPLLAREAQAITLPPGAYVCVVLGMAREALNGVFGVRLTVEGQEVFRASGDVNTTPNPRDVGNFHGKFDLVVS